MSVIATDIQTGPSTDTHVAHSRFATMPLWQVGGLSGVAGAVAAELFAQICKAFDVSLSVGSSGASTAEPIPFGGFAIVTLCGPQSAPSSRSRSPVGQASGPHVRRHDGRPHRAVVRGAAHGRRHRHVDEDRPHGVARGRRGSDHPRLGVAARPRRALSGLTSPELRRMASRRGTRQPASARSPGWGRRGSGTRSRLGLLPLEEARVPDRPIRVRLPGLLLVLTVRGLGAPQCQRQIVRRFEGQLHGFSLSARTSGRVSRRPACHR